MVSFFQVAVLTANTIVLIYYGGKWIKIRSLYKKIEESQEVSLTEEDLKAHVGGYVYLTGTIKSLTESLPSKYSEAVTAVVQNTQRIKHQVVRIAGFWVRKREVIESVQCRHGRMALFDPKGALKVEVRDPIWGLNQATNLDLFTGYRNVSWPVSNVFYDRFTVNPQGPNPFKIILNGIHEVGVQETESLIIDGSHLSALGHLRLKGGDYSIMVDLLTACDRNMLLKKLSDIRSEVATKLIIFGTLAIVFGLIFFRKRRSDDDKDWDR